ncbi:MAG: DUF2252 family protein [Polyangiaceae bacterium]|nr:DUF2252 family protein [Polyangiaceae bacterium]MBK8939969.1 DUF2252 family protein [Polyangiaceae bacterium]
MQLRSHLVLGAGALLAVACAPALDDPRERELVGVVTAADQPLLLTRPALVAHKYRVMAEDPFQFLRGSFAVYLHDSELGNVGGAPSPYARQVYPLSIGDAHVENFGTLRASDGTFAVEPNDFDAADRYPYLWEVRRLAIAVVIAARQSNAEDPDARSAAIAEERSYPLALARAYTSAIERGAATGDRERRTTADGSPVLEDAFERSVRDAASRRELQERTIVAEGERKLARGPVDPDDPENLYVDLPEVALAALPETLSLYEATLPSPLGSGFLALKDAARELGAGVASLPRLRIVLLVEGPTASLDDDVLLELKEIADTGAPWVSAPAVTADSPRDRIALATATCWTRPDADPLWGTSELLGLSVQIKGDFDAFKTLRVGRLEDALGTPEALTAMSADLGQLLAGIHMGSDALLPGTTEQIFAAFSGDEEGFAMEQADVAVRYADRIEEDRARFAHALSVLGPTLGLEPSPADALSADMRALLTPELP